MSSDEASGDHLPFPIKCEYGSDIEIYIEESSGSSVELNGTQSTDNVRTNYHDTRLPMLEDFAGPANFTLHLPVESPLKPTWVFSTVFNQVFIKINRVLLVQFSFDQSNVGDCDLYIRAMLVYSSADHVFTPVNRCVVHQVEDDPLSKAHANEDICNCPLYKLAGHVVRTLCNDAIYSYDPKSKRHSVLSPVNGRADILYSFSCKNSCPKGMHRRNTKFVFTLENGSGKLFGRASIDVKICSCPRRDKEKLEATFRSSSRCAFNSVQPYSTSPTLGSPLPLSVQVEEDDDEDGGEMDSTEFPIQLPGEVIMEIRSEVKNIRQALAVIERRCINIEKLVAQDSS